MSCHTESDTATMHTSAGVNLGCTDCHGGDAAVTRAAGRQPPAARNTSRSRRQAHVLPRYPEAWNYPSLGQAERELHAAQQGSARVHPLRESVDYRVARESCGACHLRIIQAAERSLMATGAHVLGGGASYNNGILPFKHYDPRRGLYPRRQAGDRVVAPVEADAAR